MGALGAGYWMARAAFWILVAGAAVELGFRWAVSVFLWLIGYAGSLWLGQGGTG